MIDQFRKNWLVLLLLTANLVVAAIMAILDCQSDPTVEYANIQMEFHNDSSESVEILLDSEVTTIPPQTMVWLGWPPPRKDFVVIVGSR